MNEDVIVRKLDELIAATKVTAIPFDNRWIGAAEIGALLSVRPRTVLEVYACRADFPKANRVGNPRWKASEILQWMEDTRSEKGKRGRSRLSP